MKKLLTFIALSLIITIMYAQAPCTGSVTVGGESYGVVGIGPQCWTATNMRNTTYADGTDITPAPTSYSSEKYSNLDATKYGLLYTMKAATNDGAADNDGFVQGICPDGWHIPTPADIEALMQRTTTEGLMAAEDWIPQGGNNSTGFGLYPAGVYNATAGRYEDYGTKCDLLSYDGGTMVYHPCQFGAACGTWEFIPANDGDGYSVRCLRNQDNYLKPTVTTATVTDVEYTTATCGGNVTDNGGLAITARGVCWSTEENPTVSDSHTSDGTSTGSFTSTITGLTEETTYHVRAYATNSLGTSYGVDYSFTTTTSPFICGTSTVKDVDENIYNTVLIGDQCWMKENLRTTKYADGTTISSGIWTPGSNSVDTYGRLYSWTTVMNGAPSSNANPSNVQGICPTGWHVPSDAEWIQMEMEVGMSQSDADNNEWRGNIAAKLCGNTGWISSTTANAAGNLSAPDRNSTGFSALPAGYYNGSYTNFGYNAAFLSATENDGTLPYYRRLYCDYAGVWRANANKTAGYSVRCVRGMAEPCAPTSSTHNIEITTDELPYSFGTDTTFLAGTTTGTYILHRTNAGGCDSTITINLTVNAIPTDITDTIAFVPNGGIGAPDTTLVERGEEVTVPTNTYTHDGNWQFAGWNTEANGSGTPYAANATFTANGNITLFAQWNTWCDGTPQANELGTARIVSVKDHEDNWYKVVQIGSQCWLKENMRATTEPGSATHIALNSDASLTEPRIYSTDSRFVAQYGYLYNFPAAMNTGGESSRISYPHRGICPEGWHVPTNDDWALLAATAGVPDYLYVPGTTEFTNGLGKLTGGTDWMTASWGTAPGCYNYIYRDSTGFSARPAGCYYEGIISSVGESAYFWTSSEDDYYLHIYYSYGAISYGSGEAHSTGYSVRCVRNTLSVATDSATAVTTSSAILNGTVLSLGDYGTAKAGFKYGTSSNALNAKVEKSENVEVGAYNCALTGLTANTTYFYKAFVVGGNSTDTVWIADTLHFTTLSENPCSGTPTVTDADGNVYNTVKIGRQCWMAQNLRTETKRNGQGEIYNLRESSMLGAEGYDVATYGLMYDWAAVMQGAYSSSAAPSGVQGICPDGWHVPSSAEWDTLTQYVFSNDAYKCDCSSTQWEQNTPCIANALASGTWDSPESCYAGDVAAANFNQTGFSALPAGYHVVSSYFGFGLETGFWSATADNTPQEYPENEAALCRFLSRFDSEVTFSKRSKQDAYSVRCVRNIAVPCTPTSSSHNIEITTDELPYAFGDTTFLAGTATGTYTLHRTNAGGCDSTITVNLTVSAPAFTCGTSTISDVDGNTYSTVRIATQCWMKENLRTTKKPNGSTISSGIWAPGSNSVDTYGRLYSWTTVMNGATSSNATPSGVQGICPTGWHVPSDNEWKQMEMTAGMSQSDANNTDYRGSIAAKLCGNTGWISSTTVNAAGNLSAPDRNSTGFSALPAGRYTSSYTNFGDNAYFWSATENSSDYAYYRFLIYNNAGVRRYGGPKSYGYSVRCLRD